MSDSRMYVVHLSIFVLIILMLICRSSAEIHRAKTIKTKSGSGTILPRFPPSAFSDHDEEIRIPEYDPEPDTTQNNTLYFGHTTETWALSMISAMLVGLSGIFPLVVIPLETGRNLHHGAPAARLKLLLSFAVGGLLGDVFLHLLPEAWAHIHKGDEHRCHMEIGLWVLTGLFCFLIIEKIFPDEHNEDDDADDGGGVDKGAIKDSKPITGQPAIVSNGLDLQQQKEKRINGARKRNGYVKNGLIQNGVNSNGTKTAKDENICKTQNSGGETTIKTSGWLNLMANVIDNFTHGLAVAGSYCVSTKTGLITTVAVLLHEVPHEIGDFAILLQSGFDRWKAAKAQLLTASGGLLGAIAALSSESAEIAGDRTAWILPFTSGGFIYIALVTVVPDLLKETNKWESLKQILCLLCGIVMVAGVTLLCE